MRILEVPFPALDDGAVLVRNHYSLISAGTESRTVHDARLGYVAKARTRQKEVRQVVDAVRSAGLAATYRMVMNKLDAPSGLGYSSAGTVLAVGSAVRDIAVGNHVACGGATAVHADVVAVPRNLCVKLPDTVDLRAAAFTTIGAIALQGVRQAELEVGSNCVVIGLGLIGLLTAQLLDAAGVQVIGIDVDARAVARARGLGVPIALLREQRDIESVVADATRGRGTDAVIITAGTSSLDPVELAGRLCRRKARVVIVGAVPTGFSREYYYRKELDVRMSCSYGPGRYDDDYEQRGIDYPVGYVRWTENRNMEAFADLLSARKLDPTPLITHEFALADAPVAYQMILDRAEPFVGILLRYDPAAELQRRVASAFTTVTTASEPCIGVIGAGSFAQNVLLPALKGKALLRAVATARPNNARHVADRYGFAYASGDANDILADEQINTVFVLTRHDLHARYVLQALRAGRHVFVEKPLCLTLDELEEIRQELHRSSRHLMVGFNRRFAPLIARLAALFPGRSPKAIHYRINAGILPATHWVHDPQTGGGRILAEVCHFVDLARFLVGAPITRVAATALENGASLRESTAVTLAFGDGSTAAISYFSNGSTRLAKEYLEVFSAGQVAVVDDFRELRVYGDRRQRERVRVQDKGHGAEIDAFLSALRQGAPPPIPFDEIYESTIATFAILESIRSRRMIDLTT